MKKVLAIAPYSYLPYFSGGQKYISQFLEYLGKVTDLTVVTVAANDFSLATTYKTIPLLKPGFSRYMDLSLVRKITRLVRNDKFDLIIWEHPYLAWLAFRVRKKTGIETVIHTHNIEFQRFKSIHKWWWPVLRSYEKWAFKKADRIYFITPEDQQFAVRRWKIENSKCIQVPFGIDIRHYPDDRKAAREEIARTYHIKDDERILIFSGLLSYKPNLDALMAILQEINPRLMAASSFHYKLLVCGKGLPGHLNNLKDYENKNVIFTGFVRNINTFYKASDMLLNPVQTGGGIKTKMIEAIAYGAAVIATDSGAAGVDPAICGKKLIRVTDNNWEGFAREILGRGPDYLKTPESFYEHYYWENITHRILPIP